MPTTVAQYTFVPWLRRGIAASIPEADTLGQGDGTQMLRAALRVDLVLRSTSLSGAAVDNPAITKTLSLLGPGDIRGIRDEAIVRVHPRDGTRAFEASALAYVDFYEEDFPWRYTPARVATASEPADRHFKLRPWIALLVLADDEFTAGVRQDDLPASIVLAAAEANTVLPLETETWAWAHAQISKSVTSTGAVDAEIRADPDHAVARLVAPRRLAPERNYTAFLVPAFETGRLVGLGEDPSAISAQAPSWRAGAMPHSTVRPLEFPVYRQWSFRTTATGDFESLVRALVPGPVGPEFGKRDVDMQAPGFGMDGVGPDTMAVEGALRPPSFSRVPYPTAPGTAFRDRLSELLDISENLERGASIGIDHPFHVAGASDAYGPAVPDDPILTPPVFGKWHAGVARLADASNDAHLAWLLELNLDPRNRAAAGLGVEVIQKRQDELVERAWQQVGEVERANRLLRHAELATAAGEAIYDKHFARTDPDRVLRLTAAAHRRMLAPASTTTLHAEVKASQVPISAQIGTFKRVTRPQQRTIRLLANGSGSIEGFHRNLVTNFNLAVAPLTAAPARPVPDVALAFATVSSAVQSSIGDFTTDGDKPRYFFMEVLVADLSARLSAQPPQNIAALNLDEFKTALHGRIATRQPPLAAGTRTLVDQLIDSISVVAPLDPQTVQVTIPVANFDDAFGKDVAGKSYSGVTVVPSPGRTGEISKMTAVADLETFQSGLSSFNTDVLAARTDPPPPSPLAGLNPLASHALTVLQPRTALVDRVSASIGGFEALSPAQPRQLAPVMAYPVFPDAMFEDLRGRSADFIIPNYSDLPANTLTLLEDNQRFIEAFFAGLNHEMARELLWREYPTDQRGTYFRAFWDTRDANQATPAPQIKPMDQWDGALGAQAQASGGHLVLVIRGELLRKYPTTVVYAQKAAFAGDDQSAPRVLTDEAVAGNVRLPIFRGDLAPDIAIFGFLLGEDEARGHRPTGPNDTKPADPGFFFVLKERPGEPSFGLDEPGANTAPLASWNDLTWGHLTFPAQSPSSVAIAANPLVLDGTGDPDTPTAGEWGKTAADMAYILLQNPVLYARHAEELLP